MFNKSNMPEQSKKLLTMLSYVITKFNKPEDITGEEKKHTKRHRGYNTQPHIIQL